MLNVKFFEILDENALTGINDVIGTSNSQG